MLTCLVPLDVFENFLEKLKYDAPRLLQNSSSLTLRLTRTFNHTV